MPNQPTHTKITACVQIAGLALFVYADPIFAVGWQCGCATTYWVNPDLDVSIRKLPYIVQLIGFGIYKELIPHRAGLYKSHWHKFSLWKVLFFSHIPLLGTFLRFILLLYIPIILLLLLGAMEIFVYTVVWALLSGWLMGMTYSDVAHTTADLIVTGFKHLITRIKNALRSNWENGLPRERRKKHDRTRDHYKYY